MPQGGAMGWLGPRRRTPLAAATGEQRGWRGAARETQGTAVDSLLRYVVRSLPFFSVPRGSQSAVSSVCCSLRSN